MRPYASWRLRTYCSECMRTTWFLRVDKADGRVTYRCVGNPKAKQVGCGHELELKPRND